MNTKDVRVVVTRKMPAAVEAEIQHLVTSTIREGLADNPEFRRKVMEALVSVFSRERW